jgi:hypothetical protein
MIAIRATYDGKEFRPLPSEHLPAASAALKWHLHDEEARAEADALLRDFFEEKIELPVPSLFDYEIANALKVAVVRS